MPMASAELFMREHDAAGRALYLELACLRIIDFLLIGYLRPVPPPITLWFPLISPVSLGSTRPLTGHYTTPGLHRTVFAQALMVEPALRFCSPHATICAFAYLCAPITENVPPEEPPTIPPGYHRFRSCAHRVPGYNGNWPVAANKRIGKAHKATRDICNDVKLRKVSWWLTTEAVLRRFR